MISITSLLNPVFAVVEPFKQALSYFDQKKYRQSAVILQRLLKKDPRKALILFNLGNVNFMSSQYKYAIYYYQKVIELRSKLTPVAYLYTIKSYRKLGQYREARNYLIQNPIIIPTRLFVEFTDEKNQLQELAFNRALLLYQRQEYERAIEEINIGMDINPISESTANAKMLKALCYAKLNQNEEARQEFKQAARSNIATDLRSDASVLNMIYLERTQYRSYWLNMDLSCGYDSNIYLEPDTVTTTDTSVLFYDLNSGFDYFKTEVNRGSVGLQLNWVQNFYDSDINLLQTNIFTTFTYEHSDWWGRIGPSIQYENRGGSSFLLKTGGDAALARKLNSAETGVNFYTSKVNSLQTQYDYLAGSYFETKLFYSWFSAKHESLTPYVLVGKEEAGELLYPAGNLPLTNSFWGPGLTYYSHVFISKLSEWEFTTNIRYILRAYEPLSQPGSITREDKVFTVNFIVSKTMSKQYKAFFNPTFLKNISTLNSTSVVDKNLNQITIIGGIAWEML